MDIERFHILSEPQKYYYARALGVHLCTIQDDKALIHLYAVKDYYIEIVFPLVNSEQFYARAFTSLSNLEPFLQSIDIDCLFH